MGRADKTNTNSNDIRSQVGLMGVCLTSDMQHKSISTTGIYAADSGSTTILQERHGGGVTNNRVGPYHPIRVVCKHNWLETMQSCHLPKNNKTLAVLAEWYIFDRVKINRNRFDSPHGYTVAALVDLVTSHTVESSLPTRISATVDDMIRAAKQHFPPAVADQFIPTMRKMTIKNAVDELNDHLEQVQAESPRRPSSAVVSPPPTKKQKTKN